MEIGDGQVLHPNMVMQRASKTQGLKRAHISAFLTLFLVLQLQLLQTADLCYRCSESADPEVLQIQTRKYAKFKNKTNKKLDLYKVLLSLS